MIKIKKGLDLPITGQPRQDIGESPQVSTVAVIGTDYWGLKPTLSVKVGDQVKLGQELFSDKKNPGVKYTSPGCGVVESINRGERRVLQSVVIKLEGSEQEEFPSYSEQDIDSLTREQVLDPLINSGLWTSIRTRPFSKVPAVDAQAHSIFVSAMDTNPLAAYPASIIKKHEKQFNTGIKLLTKLTKGQVHLCQDPYAYCNGPKVERVQKHLFSGPHPAGLVGTHIHHIDPVSENKTVWHVGYQDVIAMGTLFLTGKLDVERTISLAGPSVLDPRLVKTRVGASLDELLSGSLSEGEHRVISGSVFSGRNAKGAFAYLGRYDVQVSVIREGREREFLGWQKPGFDKFSIKNIFATKMMPWVKFPFTTSTHGSLRAMVPIGNYEAVLPMDVEATFFLRSLLTTDSEQAILLGALEMDEEDLGLCTFVCPGKMEYGPLLRNVLTIIEKDG